MYLCTHFFLLLFPFVSIIQCFFTDVEESPTTQSLFDKAMAEYQKEKEILAEGWRQLKIGQDKLIEEKLQMQRPTENTDVIRFNVGGEIIMTTRATLTRVPKSILAILFSGRWEHKLSIDTDGNILLDFNPVLFHHLLEQLRTMEDVSSPTFNPPVSSSLVVPFEKMLRKLSFTSALASSNEIIVLNIGGEQMVTRQSTLTRVSQSKLASIVLYSKANNKDANSNLFLDHDPKLFRHLLKQLREQRETINPYFDAPSNEKKSSFDVMLQSFDLNSATTTKMTTTITATTTTKMTTTITATTTEMTTTMPITTTSTRPSMLTNRICATAKWNPNGVTVAGGNGVGSALNQLNWPIALYFDDDNGVIYISDRFNNRIVKWTLGASSGRVIAGGNGEGSSSDQIIAPRKIIVDKNGTMFICDQGNRRIQRWYKNDYNGDTIAESNCWGLAIDNERSLYFTDYDRHRVAKWPSGEVTAGGHGPGNAFKQLSGPHHIFVDEKQSIFVTDFGNSRIMKWPKGAKEGVMVVNIGVINCTMSHSTMKIIGTSTSVRLVSVLLDRMGNVYMVDRNGNAVIRWLKDSNTCTVIIGGQGSGNRPNQLNEPNDIVFDRHGNMFISDSANHRIQMFLIDKSSCT